MQEYTDNEISVKSVLSETFEIFKKLLQPLILIYLAWLFIFSVLSMVMGVENVENLKPLSLLLFIVIAFILSSFLAGSITAIVWSYLNNLENPVKAGISRCLEVIASLLGANLLTAAFVLGGFLLLIIPGFIVALALCLVTPVVIIENPSISASLKRSYELTDGKKVQILYIILVLIAVAVGSSLILTILNTVTGVNVGSVLMPAVNGLITIFNLTMYVVIYRKLTQTNNEAN